ncbi:unnamed protein product, partial [Arabidopsis halleri]
MEACFQSCQVPEEEQLSYALDTLTGPAYEWWEQEENVRVKYNEPAHTWGSFKLEIYEEFVKEVAAQHQQHMPNYSYTKPRRWILATTPKVKATPKKTCSPKPNKTFAPILEKKREAKLPTRAKAEPPMSNSQAIIHKTSTKPLLKLQCTGTQGKSTNLSKSKEIICYRCHKRGHFAANCPTRQVDKSPSLISKLDACLVPSRIEISNSSIMLLSMPKGVDAGQTKEHEAEDVEGGISIEKPSAAQQPIQTRGNYLDSQKRMKPNLLSLGAGKSVLRSKLFQGRGYDAVITPETEPKLIQIGCTMRIRPEKDIHSFREPYQLNYKDSRQETTWKIFSAHLHNPSKKNQPKRSFHEGVIQFTNRMIPSLPDLDIYGFIGAFQPDQRDLGYGVNFPTFLIHQRSSSNWNQVKTNFGLEDINFLNQNILGLPYLEADGFSHLQTKLWRPGEFLIQLEASNITSSFILSHWIKWIPSWPFIHQDFPYLDSIAFHALQQLNTFKPRKTTTFGRLSMNQRLLERGYVKKISRYKHFPILAHSHLAFKLQRLISFVGD